MIKALAWLHKDKYEWGNEKLGKEYKRCWDALMAMGLIMLAAACYCLGIMSTGVLPPEWVKNLIMVGATVIIIVVSVTEAIRYSDKVHKEQGH